MRRRRGDEGFTVMELMVSLAVFSVLMAIVGAAILWGFGAIRSISARSDAQAQAQNAAEWAARLLSYADAPDVQTSAIIEAGPSSITFYTYSGTGTKYGVPYKARLYVATLPTGERVVRSAVYTPTQSGTTWTWGTSPVTRDLMVVPAAAGTPLAVHVDVCDPTTNCPATWRDATPAVSGSLVLGVLEVPQQVRITIGDPAQPALQVSQTTRLVNLA